MSLTPSGNNSLSLFGTEAQPPSPIEGASAVEIHEPVISGNLAPAGESVSFDNVLEPAPEPGSAPPLRTRGLNFVPSRGQVLWCDFQGFRPGEIGDKVRPVIVISRKKLNTQTVCVVPLSQAGQHATPFDVLIPADSYPFFSPGIDRWAKVQLLTHVEHTRLGPMLFCGRPCVPSIGPADLSRVLAGVASIFSLPLSFDRDI